MNKISCEIILDLIPLVKDNVASEASGKLVKDHMETCEVCKELYNSFETDGIVMNESKVISKIKRQLFITSMVVIVIASMVGLALSETMGMFYNILIMPFIGAIGYFVLGKKAYFVPASLFIFSYIWLFIKYIGEGMLGEGFIFSVITIPIYWSLIYAGLAGVGVVIGFLLKYAFGKEKSYENEKR